MSRLALAFKPDRPALVAYMMAGEPDLQRDVEYALAVLAEADVLEIGVPFSDPVADGPTIERAHTRALARGASLTHAFDLAKTLRAQSSKPLVLMTYYNPVLQRGLDKFARECREAGVDGVILPDCPLEESGPAAAALAAERIDLIQLASPATPPERLARLAKATRGFLYVISSYGTTGARDELPPEALDVVARARAACGMTPFAVGFGISLPAHVRQLHAAGAPGVVVGSAIVGRIEKGDSAAQASAFVRSLR
ncbi:MAG: tryptophan synthase subunit alpha [Candidatus Thermoplasmatota archaeon]